MACKYTGHFNSFENQFESALKNRVKYIVQARAPNSPVIVVGTHVDQVLSNIDRFPTKYLQNLDAQIRGFGSLLVRGG